MNTTRIGKIARLPKHIRDELGRRLEDGEPGRELVKWLNGLPGVQRVLKEQFDGRPVTEQNLSEWKQGGHPEWLRQEKSRSLVASVTEQAEDLGDASDGQEISDLFASVLAAELTQMAMALLEKETDPEKRWKIICEVHRELSQLRRDDHRAVRNFIKRKRWNRETEREDEEEEKRRKQDRKQRLREMCFSVLQKKTMAEMFGGGDYGEKMAEMLHRIEFDLPLEDLIDTKSSGKTHPDEIKPNPGESDPIQSNPT
jgi:hypothetical protein